MKRSIVIEDWSKARKELLDLLKPETPQPISLTDDEGNKREFYVIAVRRAVVDSSTRFELTTMNSADIAIVTTRPNTSRVAVDFYYERE